MLSSTCGPYSMGHKSQLAIGVAAVHRGGALFGRTTSYDVAAVGLLPRDAAPKLPVDEPRVGATRGALHHLARRRSRRASGSHLGTPLPVTGAPEHRIDLGTDGAAVRDLAEPLSLDDRPRRLPASERQFASTALALAADTAPRSTSEMSSARPVGRRATASARRPSAACWLSRRLNSPDTQLAAFFASTPSATTT